MSNISNNEIKTIKSLSQKKFRDSYGLFIVEGEKMVEEAKKSNFTIEKIYYKDEIGSDKMSRISALSSPSPVLAVLKQPKTELEKDEINLESKLYLALDGVRDPGNLGTIIRIAEWFGIEAIFASKDTVELFNPKVVQSTMGAIFRMKIFYVDIEELTKKFINNNGSVYGTFLDGENIYKKEINTGKDSPSLVVIGNESEGISPKIEKLVTDKLYIPPYPIDNPGSESLNAAIATAITLSEFRRR